MANLTLITKSAGAVSAYDDSAAYHSFLGSDDRAQTRGVVFLGAYGGFEATPNQGADSISVASGSGALYGRQFRMPAAGSFALGALTGTKYCLVYAEVNTKNVTAQTAKLKMAYDAGGYPVPANSNLSNEELGVAAMPLWRFIHKAGDPSPISNLTRLFEGRAPGRPFAARSLRPGSTIDGKSVADLKDGTSEFWKKSRAADVASASTGLGGHSFASDMTADGAMKGLALADTAVIRSDAHTTGADNVAGNCWWAGDSIKYTMVGALPSNSQGSVFGFLISISLSTTYWNAGFLGIGSHWEYREQNWRASLFTRNSVFLKYDDTAGTLKFMNRHWMDGENTAEYDLMILPETTLYYKTGTVPNYNQVTIAVKGSLRFYGTISITPIIQFK